MIELRNVNFHYGEDQEGCLQNVNLKINKGEVVLLAGESGCGKTTMTRLMNGLIPHYYEGNLTGEVLVDNKRINEIPLYDTASMVGSVFQNPRSQFFNVDTDSELAFGCENQGMPEDTIQDKMEQTIKDFRIHKLMGRNIFHLSGGEKQKIACASVSVADPDIFILDEPSSNLDMAATEDLKECISIWKKQGKTIVVAEHRLGYLKGLADRILYIKDGRITEEYTIEELEQLSTNEMEHLGLRSIQSSQLERKSRYMPGKSSMQLNDFQFAYNRQNPILNIPNLTVPQNEVIAIIGYNGAGKSTFARCLCGLEKKCKGILQVGNESLNNKGRLKNCYMVMQDVNHQLFTESVLDEVMISMEKPNEKNAEELLASLDLLEMKERHPMSLSGGQKQRVAIASAIASERKIILFDEPTSGLDLNHMKEVAANIKKMQEMGKSVFVISHDLELILRCCTYVIRVEQGKVFEQYALDEDGTERVISFFSSSETKE